MAPLLFYWPVPQSGNAVPNHYYNTHYSVGASLNESDITVALFTPEVPISLGRGLSLFQADLSV
jgi:hypothetical protein